MEFKNILVLGGSACSAAGLEKNQHPWPALLEREMPHSSIETISIGGLTLIQSINILSKIPKYDLLILHFGTSVGWPRIIQKSQDRFGIKFSSDFGFQQPLLERDKPILYRLRKFVKLKVKNFIKYWFALIGFYRPKTSIHEVEDQIKAVYAIASQKADSIVWVQHRGYTSSRTRVERFHYERFYRRILDSLDKLISKNFSVVKLPESFDDSENYLSDIVHLSEQGHRKILEYIQSSILNLKQV